MISSHSNEYKIIADFESDVNPATSEALRHKWGKKHLKSSCKILPVRKLLDDTVTLSSLKIQPDEKIKIDVLVHSIPGCEKCSFQYIDDKGNIQKYIMGYVDLAKILSRLIGNYNDVVINLICCSAAKGDRKLDNITDDPKKSFAVKLQQHLSEVANKDIKVIARTEIVGVDYNKDSPDYGRKFTTDKKYTYDQARNLIKNKEAREGHINKQPGTKVEITHGLIADSYSKSWKEKVLMELDILYMATDVKQKKDLYQTWITEFPNKEPEDIFIILRDEIHKPNSILTANSLGILNFFNYKSGSYDKVKDLVKEGEEYISNRFVSKVLK